MRPFERYFRSSRNDEGFVVLLAADKQQTNPLRRFCRSQTGVLICVSHRPRFLFPQCYGSGNKGISKKCAVKLIKTGTKRGWLSLPYVVGDNTQRSPFWLNPIRCDRAHRPVVFAPGLYQGRVWQTVENRFSTNPFVGVWSVCPLSKSTIIRIKFQTNGNCSFFGNRQVNLLVTVGKLSTCTV